MPVLEWHEVKDLATQAREIEDIGCWSVWQAVQTRESAPRINNALSLQGLGEQIHVTEHVVKLIYVRKTYHGPLPQRRSKSILETHMIHMLTSGVSPRCSFHLVERRAWYHLKHQRCTVLYYHQMSIWPVLITCIMPAATL